MVRVCGIVVAVSFVDMHAFDLTACEPLSILDNGP
jgi:hypothetical protein